MKSRGVDTIGWDGWGRMSGGSFNGSSLSYGFDASGAWRSRISGAKTTRYLLGDDFETDGTGTLTASYTPGPAGDLAQYSGPPAAGTAVSFLYYDDHGNVVAEANGTGTRTAAHSYDPFGAPLDTQPANSTVHRFTGRWGKQYDTSSGLIQMGERPYDPNIGRFLAVDPVEGGSLNNYDYAGQDPINGYDLPGTEPEFGEPPEFNIMGPVWDGPGDEAWDHGACGCDEGTARRRTSGAHSKRPRPTSPRPGAGLSTRGAPNSEAAIDYGHGRGTIRAYAPDGRARTDYDFGHDHGAGDPHAHDWNWDNPGKRKRGPGRPLRPGE